MSEFYRKFREEIVAGGDTVDQPKPVNKGTSNWLTLAVILTLIVWLGLNNLWTLLFVLGLLVSVFLHEVGHFVTARWTGMKVTQFYMGFGPRIWSRRRGELEYGFRAFPLGAFVRIIGMSNLDPVDSGEEGRAYMNKSYPKRMLVITAGSLMHVAIAFVLFLGVYTTAGRYSESGRVTVVDVPAVGSPAERSGVRRDDVIVNFDGVPVATRDELVAEITAHRPGDEVSVNVLRAGSGVALVATLGPNPNDATVAYFGVSTWSLDYVEHNVVESIGYAAYDVVDSAVRSVVGVFTVLNPVNILDSVTNENADPTSRPSTVVGASQLGGELGRQEGLKGVLMLLAGVNIFVGMFNMFPLLPFDGGHAAIATYERIRSRKGVPYRADVGKMVPVATAVVALLAMLLLAGLYLDITQPLG
jgi:membrane-associated protease RseP (regulator of RpoE activity)